MADIAERKKRETEELSKLVSAFSSFQFFTPTKSPVTAAAPAESPLVDDDGEDSSSDSGDGNNAVPLLYALDDDDDEEDEEDDEPPSMDEALRDPKFLNMCMYLLKVLQQIFGTYADGQLAVSQSTFEAVNIFVYEKCWLPLQGYPEDEDDRKCWVDVDKLVDHTKSKLSKVNKK